jgi:hypothetical protein|tara:strand:+ start:1848 stop:3041 length:1194 start_codon:yes stop_codon:yes gene_type:complete
LEEILINMLFERKLSENELEQREAVLQGLLKNKRNLVKKYGKDAEKVMYGIATKKAKSKVESMNKEKIRELIYKALTKEDNDPSGENLEGDPGEHVEEGTCGYDRDVKGKKLKGPGGLSENSSQDDAVMELRNIIDDLEDKAEEAREIVRQYFPNELSRLDGYGVFNVAYSGNRYDVTLGKFVDGLEEGNYDDLDDEDYVNEDNNREIKGQELVDYIMKNWSWSEEKTLNWLANNFGKNKQDDGPKEKDPRYIDYLRRSGRDEYADELEKKLKEAELTKPETKKIKDMVKSLRKSSKGHAGQANYLSKLVKEKVVRKKLAKAPKADKLTSKQKMKTPSGLVSYMDFSEQIYEKLSKKDDVGDFVDDFKKSDAKQFKGKSDKKKKQMAVAAYLSKQND